MEQRQNSETRTATRHERSYRRQAPAVARRLPVDLDDKQYPSVDARGRPIAVLVQHDVRVTGILGHGLPDSPAWNPVRRSESGPTLQPRRRRRRRPARLVKPSVAPGSEQRRCTGPTTLAGSPHEHAEGNDEELSDAQATETVTPTKKKKNRGKKKLKTAGSGSRLRQLRALARRAPCAICVQMRRKEMRRRRQSRWTRANKRRRRV